MISAPLRLAGGVAGLTLHELAPGGAVHLKMQVGFRHRYLLVYSSVQKAPGQSVAIIAIAIRGVKIPSAAASSSPPSFPAIGSQTFMPKPQSLEPRERRRVGNGGD